MSLKSLKGNKGFTLIELMIVVAIIGILAAVAIPKFADLVTKSKEAATKGNLGAVRSAVSIYYSDTEGIYPVNLFNALTAQNRYLPSVAGVPSLGRFTVPSHSNNTGHTTALYENASTVAAFTLGADPSTIGDSNAAPIYYSSGTDQGSIYVQCGHKDTKGNPWSTY